MTTSFNTAGHLPSENGLYNLLVFGCNQCILMYLNTVFMYKKKDIHKENNQEKKRGRKEMNKEGWEKPCVERCYIGLYWQGKA